MVMIKIDNKPDCCGCKACGDVCPKGSISFILDEEGFWYPKVDLDTCIDCHLCEKVCPVIHYEGVNTANSESPKTYIIQHKDVNERFDSTSGAAYPAIAKYYLKHGYYVAGHVFTPDFSVTGYVTNKIEDLNKLRKSKYLQSDLQGVYSQIKKLLNDGNKVLFSGCPCQIAALKTFLRKEYNELLTVDFTCMGIDSPWAFQKYIQSMERQYDSKLVYFKSKSKETGWRDLTNKMIFENGNTYFGTRNIDPNLRATFLDILMRPSCFQCRFKGLPRISDITIGDYWHRRTVKDFNIDDNTGTSYYMANSKAGEEFFNNIKEEFRCEHKEASVLFRGNPYMFKSLPEPKDINRHDFYSALKNEDFKEVVDRFYEKVHYESRIKKVIINILRAFKRYRFNPFRCIRFIYYNLFCENIDIDLADSLFLVWDSVNLDLKKGSKIKVKGICTLGKKYGHRGIIHLGENSELSIDTITSETSSFDLTLGESARLNIGHRTIIGNSARVSAVKKVSVGGYSYLGGNSIISDNNDMAICSDEKSIMAEPTTVGVHCWIGQNSMVAKGTTMGDEVILEPNSVAEGNISPRVKIKGFPAYIVKKNIQWFKQGI